MDMLEELEFLALVSKITSEVFNHTGVNDKTLAEYIINLHRESVDLAQFEQKLQDSGAEFSRSFSENLDRLIKQLDPKKKRLEQSNGNDHANGTDDKSEGGHRKRQFPGLAIPDGLPEDAKYLEDSIAQLEAVAAPSNNHKPSAPQWQRDHRDYHDHRNNNDRHRRRSGDSINPNDRLGHHDRSEPRQYRDRYRDCDSNDDDRYRGWHRDRRHDDGDQRGRRRRSISHSPEHSSDRSRRHSLERSSRFSQRSRPRSRSPSRSSSPSPTREQSDREPVLFKIYPGRIRSIKDFGCFVTLRGLERPQDGLVHVSNIVHGQRLDRPQDVVSLGQQVIVKVLRYDSATGKISLSMKDVDQISGADLNPENKSASQMKIPDSVCNYIEQKLHGNSNTGSSSVGRSMLETSTGSTAATSTGQQIVRKRLTSPEVWELKQLVASGVLPASAIADYDDDLGSYVRGERALDIEEDVEVEVREDEPEFLKGQTEQSVQLSPIKVVRAPDGSLNRAAISGASLAKDRRDEREKVAREQEERAAVSKDLSTAWLDPMADPSARKFAADVRSAARAGREKEPWRALRGGSGKESFGKRTTLSIREQRETLPVFSLRDKFIEAISANQLLIVVGDTGSGKTTQLTQYLAEDGFTRRGRIACTQPRRVAAMSVAKRVAEEVSCRVGDEVGYTIRFEDCTSSRTKIKYMTDGMLERECLLDPDLRQYSVVILDEAHERTIATDVLFGLLKQTARRRPDLKIVVTSATLDAEKFSAYFFSCPIFTIPGRTFPVEVLYSKEPEADYLDAALVTVMQIHLAEPPGDILLFLTGQEEIDTSCEVLAERMQALGAQAPPLIILPVYSALPSEIQSRIFEPAPSDSRKVVIATNIAETSITIDGIYYVIDPGFVKQNCYDPKLGMDSLVVTPISQAQARQRAGRAGRTGPGKCFRLYTESAFKNEMLPNPVPEIQRQNLAHTILMLKAMGINDLLHFDFMDPPPTQTLVAALENLYALAALDNEGLLTRLGRKMSDFPMEPPLAKVLIASVEYGCSEEILSIVGMLSVQSVWYRPRERQQQADQRRARFVAADSDHLTLLNVYNAWKAHGASDSWCYDNFVQARGMRRAEDVRKQLLGLMERYKHPIVSCGRATDQVLKALCSGFFRNVARRDPHEGHYTTIVEGTPVYLHPSSALFGKGGGEWVLYHELVLTTKEYMHSVSVIKPQFLVEAAPNFFKLADPTRISKAKQRDKIVPLFSRGTEGDDWRISKQRRGPARSNQLFGGGN